MDTAAIVTCVRNFPHHRGSIVGALLLHRACHICSMLEMLLSCNKATEMEKTDGKKQRYAQPVGTCLAAFPWSGFHKPHPLTAGLWCT